MNSSITAVAGLTVGHASSEADQSGCTVLLGPFRAAVDVRGLATGTREIDALDPTHLVPRIDALLLTGGASSRLLGAIRSPGREIPDLVLRGLAVVAAQT